MATTEQDTKPAIRTGEPAFEDLTARARIRDAAMRQFTEHGYERTTIRGIAAAAGVSPGLVRHHFGSKEALRAAIDEYVLHVVRRVNDDALRDGRRGDLGPVVSVRRDLRHFQRYLTRALLDGSKTAAAMFDEMTGMGERWIAMADQDRTDPPLGDVRTRAVLVNAMKIGVALLQEHIERVLDIDMFSPEGERQIAAATLDLYSHRLITPELAATALAAFDVPPQKPAT